MANPLPIVVMEEDAPLFVVLPAAAAKEGTGLLIAVAGSGENDGQVVGGGAREGP